MLTETEVWIATLVGIGLIVLLFIYVVIQARRPPDESHPESEDRDHAVLRRWLFAIFLVIFVGVSVGTLWSFPLPPQHRPLPAKQIVTVVGHQWDWELSTNQITAGVPVEFRVTSKDVNHDFSIYSPAGRILVQAQAMPGYVNKILYTFDKPGTYRIRCLEYCGIGHTGMTSELDVVAANTGGHSP